MYIKSFSKKNQPLFPRVGKPERKKSFRSDSSTLQCFRETKARKGIPEPHMILPKETLAEASA